MSPKDKSGDPGEEEQAPSEREEGERRFGDPAQPAPIGTTEVPPPLVPEDQPDVPSETPEEGDEGEEEAEEQSE